MNAGDQGDYVLGTGDEEVQRLGLQHRVWRPRVLAAWKRAGLGRGHTVLDAGSGPGFATLDLADIVGPSGRVVAIERSKHYASVLRTQAARRALGNLTIIEGDLDELSLDGSSFDRIWCRWVLAFVVEPRAVLAKMIDALRPGGTIVFHEYFDYGTWRMAPRLATLEEFVRLVMKTWRDAKGEPDVGLAIPAWLEELGMNVVTLSPTIEVAPAGSPYWEWLAAFVHSGVRRLVELELLDDSDAAVMTHELADAYARGARMITPGLFEVIATRRPR
jgi:SAM-dependent methyltransferase